MYQLHLDAQDAHCAFAHACERALAEPAPESRCAEAVRALDLSGAGGYLEWCESPWADGERRRLQALARRVALAGAASCTALGRQEAAIDLLRRAVAIDPYDRGASAALVRALNSAGDAAEARRVHVRYRRLLADDLDVVS